MTIYTFHISESLSIVLGIEFDKISELSDQELSKPADMFDNYVPYGGGAKGHKNGHYGCKHTEEAKEIIRQKALGRPAPNKGVPNPAQRERLLKDNPMKKPEIAAKVSKKLKGKIPWNKKYDIPRVKKGYGPNGSKKTIWKFPDGTEKIVENTREMCENLGLSYSAVRHKIDKGPYIQGKYKGLRIDRYISHPSAEEQAKV